MEKKRIKLKPCLRNPSSPFDMAQKNKCPVFEKTLEFFEKDKWKRTGYHPSKVPNGELCYLKFEKLKPNGRLLFIAEVNLQEIKSPYGNDCSVNLMINSYEPGNRLKPINDESEKKLVENIGSIFV